MTALLLQIGAVTAENWDETKASLTSNHTYIDVRNLKFARNLIFATSKTLVNSMKKLMLCLKVGIFQFKKP